MRFNIILWLHALGLSSKSYISLGSVFLHASFADDKKRRLLITGEREEVHVTTGRDQTARYREWIHVSPAQIRPLLPGWKVSPLSLI